jgi:DNA-binding NarL/FixJ family response regulator
MLEAARIRRVIGASTDVGVAEVCNSSAMRPSVLIVDDHAAFRGAARALLEADGFPVVGEAADGASAVSAVRALRPDVVLLDIQLPDLNGFEVAERLAGEAGARPAVVFVSTRDASTFRSRLASNPSWRFIAKSDLSGEALAAALA